MLVLPAFFLPTPLSPTHPSTDTPPLSSPCPQGRRLTRKPLLPGPEEVASNPRSRSAKLRIFQKAGGSSDGAAAERQQGRGSRKRQRAASGED
jgi:hypothetical protein